MDKTQIRSQLAQITERKSTVRDALKTAREIGDDLAASQGETSLAAMNQQEARLLNALGQGVPDVGGRGIREQLSDPHLADRLATLAHSSARVGDLQLGAIDRPDVAAWTGGAVRADQFRAPALAEVGVVTPTPGMSQGPFYGIASLPQPAPRFLDFVPTVLMEAASVPFAREVAVPGGSGPAPSAPGSIKAGVSFTYQDAEANPATIAGWVKLPKQSLADTNQLQRRDLQPPAAEDAVCP